MIHLNLDPVKLAADIMTISSAPYSYSYSTTPGLVSGDKNDPYGYHEFFIENDLNAPFINKGIDLGGNYWFQQNPQGVGLGLIIRIGTPLIGGGYQVFVYGPRSNPNAQNGWTASDWASTSAAPNACDAAGPMPPPITPKPIHPPPVPTNFIIPPEHPVQIPPLPPPPKPTVWPEDPDEPILTDDGGVVGDPHCEGFDNLFDFHGESNKCYQLYKSKSLLVNCQMTTAHCNGTFMECLYIRSYQNGKEFEVVFAVGGTADLSKVFVPLKASNKHLTQHPSMNKFLNEIKNNNWKNLNGVLLKIDIGNIYLVRSTYLNQPHVNFKITPNIIETDATGIIGQTQNMKIRLPNKSFEIPYINSELVKVLQTIT